MKHAASPIDHQLNVKCCTINKPSQAISQASDKTASDKPGAIQYTNEDDQVSFISIFPGWYGNRAPHIHLEVFDNEEIALLITQIAFDEKTCNEIYATKHYHGSANGKNEEDFVFANSLEANMVDSLTGNINNGYTLVKKLIV